MANDGRAVVNSATVSMTKYAEAQAMWERAARTEAEVARLREELAWLKAGG
jgi:hypothetical protein